MRSIRWTWGVREASRNPTRPCRNRSSAPSAGSARFFAAVYDEVLFDGDEGRLEERLLVGEVVVERAPRADSGLGDDLFGAGAVVSLFDEQSPGGVEESGASGLGLRGTSRLRVEPSCRRVPSLKAYCIQACRSHTVQMLHTGCM